MDFKGGTWIELPFDKDSVSFDSGFSHKLRDDLAPLDLKDLNVVVDNNLGIILITTTSTVERDKITPILEKSTGIQITTSQASGFVVKGEPVMSADALKNMLAQRQDIGVITGDNLTRLFAIAKKEGYALPAVNVINTDSINAVLETARGAIIRRGLAYNKCDIAVFLNVGEFTIGIFDDLKDAVEFTGKVAIATKEFIFKGCFSWRLEEDYRSKVPSIFIKRWWNLYNAKSLFG